MILKTLKRQLAVAVIVAAGLSAPNVAGARSTDYCICVGDCWNGGGGPTDPVACMDWCATVHMVTLCAKAELEIPKDRR